MNILYVEAFSGMSGDMFLGALAGLTDSYEELKKLPEALNLPDAKVEIDSVNKNGIQCKHVHVIDKGASLNTGHTHRHLSQIIEIIDSANIADNAKRISKEIFLIIGRSESKIHNIPLEKIHFHEISAVDSLVDIIGSAVMIDQLDIGKTYATAVCTGFGFVDTQHGKLPVPAPATADILVGIPQDRGDEEGERVTPTGAAILKYLKPEYTIPELSILKTVYGPGSKNFISPNVLRLSLCDTRDSPEDLYVLETNIDDLSGELLGSDFQSALLEQGATDFFITQVQMKKGRPGILLSSIVAKRNLEKLTDYILEHTSTIGVRFYPIKRKVLQREVQEFDTPYGKVKAKVVVLPSGAKRASIEYEDLKELQNPDNTPLQKIQQEIISIINVEL